MSCNSGKIRLSITSSAQMGSILSSCSRVREITVTCEDLHQARDEGPIYGLLRSYCPLSPPLPNLRVVHFRQDTYIASSLDVFVQAQLESLEIQFHPRIHPEMASSFLNAVHGPLRMLQELQLHQDGNEEPFSHSEELIRTSTEAVCSLGISAVSTSDPSYQEL